MSPRASSPARPVRVGPATERLLSQREAATLAGCSKDTIVRARRAGRLPHARLVEGRWAIPADDLDAAGLLPAREGDPPDGEASERPAGESPVDLSLARAEARVVALQDLVARQDAELDFLRRLAADTVAKRAS